MSVKQVSSQFSPPAQPSCTSLIYSKVCVLYKNHINCRERENWLTCSYHRGNRVKLKKNEWERKKRGGRRNDREQTPVALLIGAAQFSFPLVSGALPISSHSCTPTTIHLLPIIQSCLSSVSMQRSRLRLQLARCVFIFSQHPCSGLNFHSYKTDQYLIGSKTN